ncbi:MAG: hypothetical protein AAGC68_11650 [Verrucomicrobiota bacterium]
MKEEIDAIRESLFEMNALDEETREALLTLEEAIDEIDRHAGNDELFRHLSDAVNDAERHRSQRWRDLKSRVDDWEDHHPKLVLSVGRIAEALASVGL